MRNTTKCISKYCGPLICVVRQIIRTAVPLHGSIGKCECCWMLYKYKRKTNKRFDASFDWWRMSILHPHKQNNSTRNDHKVHLDHSMSRCLQHKRRDANEQYHQLLIYTYTVNVRNKSENICCRKYIILQRGCIDRFHPKSNWSDWSSAGHILSSINDAASS